MIEMREIGNSYMNLMKVRPKSLKNKIERKREREDLKLYELGLCNKLLSLFISILI